MKKFYFIIFFLTLIIFITRSFTLYKIEPIGDHSFYIWWINSIINSDHFFPHQQINFNLIDAIKIDKLSLIHNLILPVYVSVTTLFTTVSLLYFSFGNIFFDNVVVGNIILSILANSLSIATIPIYLIYFRKNFFNLNEVIIFAIFFIFLISTSSFFYAFSTQGPHNLGILFLYLYLIFFSKYFFNLENKEKKKKYLFISLVFQFLAFYSMYTNIFLIPVFVFISLIFFSNINIKERLFEIFKISLLTLLILFPGLIALIIIETFGVREDSYQGFFGWGKWAFNFNQYNSIDTNHNLASTIVTYLIKNIQFWFNYNATILGKTNFLIGILGIILFRLKYKNPILLSLLLSHLFVSIIMVGFNNAGSRTYAYLLPLFYFGITLFFIELFKYFQIFKIRSIRISLLIVLIILIFTYQIKSNFYKFLDPSLIKANWSEIYKKENNEIWKKLSRTILNTVDKKSLIVAPTSTYKYFLETQINNANYIFFSSLDTLETSPDNIKLQMYKSKIKKEIDYGYKIYIISFEKDLKNKENSLIKLFCEINSKTCTNKFKLIETIKSKNTFWSNLSIFELSS